MEREVCEMGDTERMSTATKIKWIVTITLPILFMLIPTNVN